MMRQRHNATLTAMAEETASVRIRKSQLKDIKRAAVEADKTITDWVSEAVAEKLASETARASREARAGRN